MIVSSLWKIDASEYFKNLNAIRFVSPNKLLVLAHSNFGLIIPPPRFRVGNFPEFRRIKLYCIDNHRLEDRFYWKKRKKDRKKRSRNGKNSWKFIYTYEARAFLKILLQILFKQIGKNLYEIWEMFVFENYKKKKCWSIDNRKNRKTFNISIFDLSLSLSLPLTGNVLITGKTKHRPRPMRINGVPSRNIRQASRLASSFFLAETTFSFLPVFDTWYLHPPLIIFTPFTMIWNLEILSLFA